jgi:hypothetical protein
MPKPHRTELDDDKYIEAAVDAFDDGGGAKAGAGTCS